MTEQDFFKQYIDTVNDDWVSAISSKNDNRTIVNAVVLDVDTKYVYIEAGAKQEGKVLLQEFFVKGELPTINIGDTVQVYKEASSDGHSIHFSHTRARKEMAWSQFENMLNSKQHAEGMIVSPAKGGYIVEVFNAPVFLPAKQLDISGNVIGKTLEVRIVRLDRSNMNVTVARKQTLGTDNDSGLEIGEIVTGVVTDISKDMLILEYHNLKLNMHARDYLWNFDGDLRQEFSIGQSLRVKIISINNTLIKVGHKQLLTDPWLESIQYADVQEGTLLSANVDKIKDSGVYMLLNTNPVLSAYLPAEELSWSPEPVSLLDNINLDQQYSVMVAKIDKKRKKIIVSMRQCDKSPIATFANKYDTGHTSTGTVKGVSIFGTTVEINKTLGVIPNVACKDGTVKVTVDSVNAKQNKLVLKLAEECETEEFDAITYVKLNTVLKFKITSIEEHKIMLAHETGLIGYIQKDDLDAHEYHQEDVIYGTVTDINQKEKQLVVTNAIEV